MTQGDENSDDNDNTCCDCLKFRGSKRRKMLEKTLIKTGAKPPKPKLPYAGLLPADMQPGQIFCITGQVLPTCARFAIDLLSVGASNLPTPLPDIAFHFNPRLNERRIVRNCRFDGEWGEEESTSIVKFDVSHYTRFFIVILVAESTFMVSLNGRHVCAFSFRVPINRVTRMEITGKVVINNVEYKRVDRYPYPLTNRTLYKTPLLQGELEPALSPAALDVPLTAILPVPLHEGWQIEVRGRVKVLPQYFYVNLQEGEQIWPHPTIPLHLNPRFCSTLGENVIVRNSWLKGGWGSEERTPSFNFTPGANFKIVIRKDAHNFSLWVDGRMVGEFRYRTREDKINTIYIQGDVFLYSVGMRNMGGRRDAERSVHPIKVGGGQD